MGSWTSLCLLHGSPGTHSLRMLGMTGPVSKKSQRTRKYLFFLVVVLRFELRALCLQVLYMPPALFALVILEIGSCFLPRPVTVILLFYTSHCSWDDRNTLHAQLFFCWDEVLYTFLPRLVWNSSPSNLCIPVSWDVTGMSHQHLALERAVF
jgi:hypothetical protein